MVQSLKRVMETDTDANMSYQDMHAGTTNVTFHRLPYHSIQLVVRQVEKQPFFYIAYSNGPWHCHFCPCVISCHPNDESEVW
jgi:hypothetical protein